MDHYTILDQNTPARSREIPSGAAGTLRGSHEIGLENPAFRTADHSLPLTELQVPLQPPSAGGSESLSDMAERDLDAALQLLAERAQYITGASGAAIALRHDGEKVMLCRATSGNTAPELGTLLSAEFGLSGECVRSRVPQRCDDAESDMRVNREGCRHLGIASVAVVPVVADDEVLGVFELFSGKPRAFEERDLSALQRLTEMVETAVGLARSAKSVASEMIGEFVSDASDLAEVEVEGEALAPPPQSETRTAKLESVSPVQPGNSGPPGQAVDNSQPGEVAETPAASQSAALPPAAPAALAPVPETKKTLLWSAASESVKSAESDQSHVPPILRNLRKCQLCGFPVSEARKLCVDCEEKQWRGKLQPLVSTKTTKSSAARMAPVASPRVNPTAKLSIDPESTGPKPVQTLPAAIPATSTSSISSGPADPVLFQTSGMATPESWFARHKYVLGVIVLIAGVLAGLALLH